MTPEDLTFYTMIGTLVSAVAAAIAAIISMLSLKSWKRQARYDNTRNAVKSWLSGAAIFRGTLKQIYSSKVSWPDDKESIEFVSNNYWQLVALWPPVHASLEGKAKKVAEELWHDLFTKYNNFMSGAGELEGLGQSVEAIYNNEQLKGVIANPR
ncbi:hypothetical protein [Pandoraea horticolens]|uniref:hypothetical protein n=1 Tax=Pandoraea horticolens TaxID=2508298 RepID=UPI00123FCEC9|nr:hypothetical protein [Pandoraea horticolens]